jgi:hypothetical protein
MSHTFSIESTIINFFSYRIFPNSIKMPRQKCCQHPTRHEDSASVAKGTMTVSLELAKFLQNQYNLADNYIRWLCPNCHSSEIKTMRKHRSTKDHDDQTSSNNESLSENSSNDDQDDESEECEENEEDEDEDQCEMDDDNGERSIAADNDDPESMDDEAGNDFHDLVFQQNQAVEKLSSIFQLLNISPIHDR